MMPFKKTSFLLICIVCFSFLTTRAISSSSNYYIPPELSKEAKKDLKKDPAKKHFVIKPGIWKAIKKQVDAGNQADTENLKKSGVPFEI